MAIRVSELLGKKIIATNGQMLGQVRGSILDVENKSLSHLLTDNVENVVKSENARAQLLKNSVEYKRVKQVSETIIVGEH